MDVFTPEQVEALEKMLTATAKATASPVSQVADVTRRLVLRVQALTMVLAEKGLITEEEFDDALLRARRAEAREAHREEEEG